MNALVEMFSYSFMTRALIVGVLISVVAALVGVSLVFRRNSMIGDGLSHTAFGAFAVATARSILSNTVRNSLVTSATASA